MLWMYREFGKVQTFIQGNSKLFSSPTIHISVPFLWGCTTRYDTALQMFTNTDVEEAFLTLEGEIFLERVLRGKGWLVIPRHVIPLSAVFTISTGVSGSTCLAAVHGW